MDKGYKKIVKCVLYAAIGIGAYYAGKMTVKYDIFGTENTVQIQQREKENITPKLYNPKNMDLENLINTSKQETFG